MTVVTSQCSSTSKSSTVLSRRTALRGLGGVTAVALLAAGHQGDRVTAQAATPSTLDPLFSKWAAAWTTDPTLVDEIYAANVTGIDYATGERFDGADSIRTHIEGLHASFTDLEFTVTSGLICGDRAVVEYIFIGTYVGQQSGGAGRPVNSRDVALFDLADGKIASETHYYDYYAVLKQIGALPGSTPAPTSAASPVAGGPTLEMADIAFNPTTLAIAANTDVTVTLTNKGIAPHNFSIDALNISVDVTPGATKTVTINAPAGTYEFYCNVPGHKAAGMVGTLTVA